MTNEDASAIAALNQTVRALVEAVRDLNRKLDGLGWKGDADGTGEGHDA